ncbi:2-dehydropantoate 2-reductase [Devosia sp. FKR38]|uniref:2-dehydropantoate 2-reductase n=1 Tax=Devosia sp. FKR38 TaxID=2562312 RepID=UPI0010C01E9F|nr:2-dehydropantoate 2-reductase [Devosia sp. FKR38]
MTSIAVVGPGAIGGTIAAWLAQNPALSVTVCARTAFEHLVVETPSGPITAHPRVLTDPATAQPVDWVMVATKTYDIDSTAPWLNRLVGANTRVAIIQNGVEHVRLFAHLVPPEQLVPVMINLPAARLAPGRIVQQRHGIIAVPSGVNGDALVALFAKTEIAASADADFLSQAWVKLVSNSAAIVPALTLRSTGPVWTDALAAIVRGIVEECAAVGRAEGAVVPDSVIEATIESARTMDEGSRGSSLQMDRMAGNRMEIDARNGVIVRLGDKHGIPTPMNRMLVTLLAASGSPWVSRG